MDLKLHFTHWKVRPDLARHGHDCAARFNCSWNTYKDHPPGMGLDWTSLDFWAGRGRGVALSESQGDALVAWLLGQHQIKPIRWLIWYGWIWEPGVGWREYNGWQGDHRDHVHVTFL